MTRILFWNVRGFGRARFFGTGRAQTAGTGGRRDFQAAGERLAYLLDTLRIHPPDIFVLTGALSGRSDSAEGDLVRDGSSLSLLAAMRRQIAPDYALVPPLVTGQAQDAQAVAIYYRTTGRFFTGPYVWPGVGPAIPAAGAKSGPYPAAWNAALPNRTTPAGKENQLAAQFEFFRGGQRARGLLQFPTVRRRRPILATFAETSPERSIRLVAWNAPADVNAALQGIARLADIAELLPPPGAVDVIAGSFTVNLFDNPKAFDPLTTRGFVTQVTAPPPFVPKTAAATLIRETAQAAPWNTSPYPGFGFMGPDAVDNILVRGPAAANITVINRVTGAPYSFPDGKVVGTYPYGQSLAAPSALPIPGGIAPDTAGALTRFREWTNYGHIRGTSDHLALVVDV